MEVGKARVDFFHLFRVPVAASVELSMAARGMNSEPVGFSSPGSLQEVEGHFNETRQSVVLREKNPALQATALFVSHS